VVNKVILVGFVGHDPEVRHLDNGLSVANFNMATTERWKDKDGNKQESTEWHRVVVWRGLAEVTEKYVKKGSQLYIDGRLRTRKWTDKNGVDRWVTEIYCDILKLLGKQEGGSGEARFTEQAEVINNEVPPTPEDDLPF
jgi:single-strand DNA-binding protein